MTLNRPSLSRLVPGPAEVVFLVVVGLVTVGGRHSLFNDPGTAWHLRLGREILAKGEVPRTDFLTFTHKGEAWVDQSWAFDTVLAVMVNQWGWSSVVAATAVGLGLIYAGVARALMSDGIAPIVAVVVAILAAGLGSIHFLVRPHLVTFAMVFLTLRACQKQHEGHRWSVMWTPIYTAILANVHGGFVALPVIVATAGIGHLISGPWDKARIRNVLTFGVAFDLCLLAGLLNPYGYGLYHHVFYLLLYSGVTSLICEYQPAPFGQPDAQILEWVLLALLALPVVSARKVDRYNLTHVLVWLHLALTSIRNSPLFAFVAAPALATLIDGLPLTSRESWKKHQTVSIWPGIVIVSMLVLMAQGFSLGGFSEELATLNREPTNARLFHEQDWGGFLEAETLPIRQSYLDDRFELFGRQEIIEYADVLTGGPAWDVMNNRDRIDLVWLKPDRGLARRLLKEPGWTKLYSDKLSIVFKRDDRGKIATTH
jgi:hypothetical protein